MMLGPIQQFTQWFEEAKSHPAIADATAMSLATASRQGIPSVRIVLLKAVEEDGFVFYTNLESQKSLEILDNPHVGLCFYWAPLGKQVRISGEAVMVSSEQADSYFASRPRDSQIGAWASQQSRPLESRDKLMQAVEQLTKQYDGKPVSRPPYWSGWKVIPRTIEFWQNAEFRLHDRARFTRIGDNWRVEILYP
ncbi:MAG: pyridoxamine 5'-phosphate oxidase [Rickettsiales bacterium]|nr:pyridoxamine 5'-phosphate oxidase [Rickettsiales bacterium]